MDNNTSVDMKKEQKHKDKNKTAVIITAICVVLVIILAFTGTVSYIMASDKIYNGVYVGEVSVGSLTKDEAIQAVKEKYDSKEFGLNLKHEDVSFEIHSSRINLKVDFDETVKSAYAYGRKGNVFKKIQDIFNLKKNPHSVSLKLTCDTDLMQHEISQYLSEYVVDITNYSVEIGEDCLVVTNGKPGTGVDIEKLMSDISKQYISGDISKPVEVEIVKIIPDKIDPDKFIEEYTRDAEDARYEQTEESYTIVPHVVGVKVNPDDAKKILKENADNAESYTIPAIITLPETTTEMVEAEFTDTIIGTYSSDYSSSTPNRKENIRLASEKINGLILNPGEVFSFNGVVGPRTAATGFKVAHVFSGNKVVDGIGGGICQVSSTLYNAVVFADLEIVYRTNHSLPVTYVPLGRDATVSYGTIDFKFKNNKETPIKLEVIADGNNLTVNVYGRKKYLKDISIETVITGYNSYSVNETKDDTMYEDEKIVVEKGENGARTDTYKIVKENGEVVSRTFLSKSSYSPTSEVVKVGTKKREVEQSPSPSVEASQQTPPPAITDVAPSPTPVPEEVPISPLPEDTTQTQADVQE